MKDHAQLALVFDKKIRIYAGVTTNLCEKARFTHGLWPTTAQLLGRTLTTTALMSLMDKNHASITVRIDADGPAGNITCDGKHGKVRGYLTGNPEIFLQYKDEGLKVGQALGNGFINITKELNNGTFYTSTSPIVSGEIAEDFTYFFATSEQTPSSVGVGMIVDTDNSVVGALGFIIQVMPGATDEIITKLEETLANIKSTSLMIKEKYTPKDIINEIFKGEDIDFLEEYDLSYECTCSKDRFYKGVITIGKEDLTTILNEDEKIDITCNFCKKIYNFNKDDINQMIEEI